MSDSVKIFVSYLQKKVEQYGKAEIHRRTKVSRALIDKYLESGTGPNLRTVDRIATAFGDNVQDIFSPDKADPASRLDKHRAEALGYLMAMDDSEVLKFISLCRLQGRSLKKSKVRK